jgi:CBS domain containing-hemolysin-like protein
MKRDDKMDEIPDRPEKQTERPKEKKEETSVLEAQALIAGLNLEEAQRKMMAGVLELSRTTVKEIMTPRPEIVCADERSQPDQIRQLVLQKGHSRIPLYHQEIDQVTGILHLRDLFVAEAKGGKIDLRQIARKPFFVPDGKKVDDLLAEMRKEKTHIALVVDEYGGIAGLVTIEDILEEVVGEIEDEYVKEEPEIQKLGESTILVKGKVGLKEINEALGSKLPEREFESVGGFIYDLVGGVPEEGKSVKHKSLKFQVVKVTGQRIKWVRVSRGK